MIIYTKQITRGEGGSVTHLEGQIAVGTLPAITRLPRKVKWPNMVRMILPNMETHPLFQVESFLLIGQFLGTLPAKIGPK